MAPNLDVHSTYFLLEQTLEIYTFLRIEIYSKPDSSDVILHWILEYHLIFLITFDCK